MIQQTLPLRCIATNEPEILADTFQMFEAGLFVLRIAIKRDWQQPQLRADHFNNGGSDVARVGQKITAPPKSTELDGESQFIGGPTALVHLLQVRPRQREVLAERIVIDPVRQSLRLFQPVFGSWTINGSRHLAQDFFAPPMARR